MLDYLNIKTLSYMVVNKFINLIELISKSFVSNKLSNIDNFLIQLLDWKTYKWDNFIQIWDNYKGGINIKWIPIDDFNVLYYLAFNLNTGDSIIINLYNQNKYSKIIEKTWIDKFIKNTDTDTQKYNYLQIIINFNEINEAILTKRINNYQLKIWSDFYSQRVVGVMWSYLNTILWIGNNAMKYERKYKTKDINNLIF
jgi:hypothetical protein